MKTLGKIFNALKSRLALNLYFWAWWVSTVFGLNFNNARAYHYNFDSPWFYIVTCTVLIMVAAMTYFNNLFLLPRYLVRKKYVHYFLIAGITVLLVALIQVCLLRLAAPHIDVNHLQQAGAASYNITFSWKWQELWHDTLAYGEGHAEWLFVFSLGWFMHDHSRQQKKIAEAERKQVETELHFLKNQVHPHFLFNTLNNLYGLALKNRMTDRMQYSAFHPYCATCFTSQMSIPCRSRKRKRSWKPILRWNCCACRRVTI